MRVTTTHESRSKRHASGTGQLTENELMRMLVGRAATSTGHVDASTGGNDEEVLLDMDLEGSRYLLVRMPKADNKVQLSPREQEIVRMVSQGHPNKVIADVLSISTWTVCTHLRRIFAKLGVGTRAAMVARVHGKMPVASAATAQSSMRRMAARAS